MACPNFNGPKYGLCPLGVNNMMACRWLLCQFQGFGQSFFFLVQTNMTSIAKKIKVQSHPVTTTGDGQNQPQRNPLPSRPSIDPSNLHTFPRTNNRVLTPIMVKLFQGFSPRGRILSKPGDNVDPGTSSIIYQAVPNRLFSALLRPHFLVEDLIIPFQPNNPECNTSQLFPKSKSLGKPSGWTR
jgi:hypothetical protein